MLLMIKFTEQENLNARSGLLLVTIKASRENLSIVDDHHVAIIEIAEDILKNLMLHLTGFLMENQEASLITVQSRELSHLLLRISVLELRKLHIMIWIFFSVVLSLPRHCYAFGNSFVSFGVTEGC